MQIQQQKKLYPKMLMTYQWVRRISRHLITFNNSYLFFADANIGNNHGIDQTIAGHQDAGKFSNVTPHSFILQSN
jgi:hypothetical protein